MTADNDHQPSPEGAAAASPENTAPAPAKKAPSRKVASRPKVSAVKAPAEEDSLPVEAKVKAIRPRRKKTAAETAVAIEETAPAMATAGESSQPRVLSTEAIQASSAPQSRVETLSISPSVMAEIERRTEEKFPRGQSHNRQTHSPADAGVSSDPASEALPKQETAAPASANDPLPASPATAPQTGDAPFAPAERVEQDRVNSSGTPERENSGGNSDGQRRYDGERPQFQGRRGDHRNHGRGDFQPRGDYQQRGDFQPQRGGRDFQDNRGNQQGGFRQQGQGGGNGGGNQNQPPQQGGGDLAVSRVTEAQYGEGIIEVSGKGFGFLRESKRNFVQTPADIFVTPEVCRKYNLRDGQWIKGEIRRSSRGPQMFRLTALNGEDPEKFRNLPNFEELTSINPKKRIKLETVPDRYTTRIMDLMTPIGKGQRGLIVAPPRTGKTTLLQHIAEAVVLNHTEMKLIILLVDERPEEVTEIRRSVPQAEIMASSNDSDLKSHTRIAQLAIERAKRLVEAGQDVFILLDSITRMARAFNNAMSGGRATQSGGLAVGALEIPRKIFAAARNTEEAGSLTIMATALIETNSKMDDAIFQEFKGTGNMELVLDRKISDQRIYPAVDIFLSGTRREELLLQGWELDKINVIRRGLAGHKPIEAIERLLSFLKKFPTNTQMLASLPG